MRSRGLQHLAFQRRLGRTGKWSWISPLVIAGVAHANPATTAVLPLAREWIAGPVIGGTDYSAPINVDSTGSFEFPIDPKGVHYVTRACGSLAAATRIRLRYRIDADPSVAFVAASDGKSAAIGPVLYFQRAGDDWSGEGKFESYRWWATFAAPTPITAGEHEIVASFHQDWTAVETSHARTNARAFRDALAHCGRIGFTFGGGSGYGHGAFSTAPARFTLLEFAIE